MENIKIDILVGMNYPYRAAESLTISEARDWVKMRGYIVQSEYRQSLNRWEWTAIPRFIATLRDNYSQEY